MAQTGTNNPGELILSSYRTDKTVNEIISAIDNNKQVIFIFNNLENSGSYNVYSAIGYVNRSSSEAQEYTLFTHKGGTFSAHSLNDYFSY